MKQQAVDPIQELMTRHGAYWGDAIPRSGMKFCGCKNPNHGKGCSIFVPNASSLCIWCDKGCNKRVTAKKL